MKIDLLLGDITTMRVDAIVNAANSSLLGGSGVDGAIHRKGGKTILEECRMIRARQGACSTGEAVVTNAGMLPSRYVIHTVGPVWQGGEKQETQLLEKCYLSCLRIAGEYQLKTLAFPNISTGIYKFPKELAASIAIRTIQQAANEYGVERVCFVCFEEINFNIYKKILND